MKQELTLLAYAVALAFAQILVAVLLAIPQVGLPILMGNREDMAPLTGAADRAQRAYRNMLESLLLFAALVLVAVLAGRTNATTLLGAQLFIWARFAYATLYVVGIPVLRTLAWFIAAIGLFLVFWQVI
ncbi:MAG: hypothetical protein EXR05_07510 [Acetobacteraceae bacterium]|nr:hypothetical protein [Acetobacteraceae bacterium]MSP29133.1 hypothetical protein [Acetobacteraceae bacterium]